MLIFIIDDMKEIELDLVCAATILTSLAYLQIFKRNSPSSTRRQTLDYLHAFEYIK